MAYEIDPAYIETQREIMRVMRASLLGRAEIVRRMHRGPVAPGRKAYIGSCLDNLVRRGVVTAIPGKTGRTYVLTSVAGNWARFEKGGDYDAVRAEVDRATEEAVAGADLATRL